MAFPRFGWMSGLGVMFSTKTFLGKPEIQDWNFLDNKEDQHFQKLKKMQIVALNLVQIWCMSDQQMQTQEFHQKVKHFQNSVPKPKPVMNKFGASYEQIMNKLWTSPEQVMKKLWTSHKQDVNKLWTSHE